jgi:hypothetical protein
MRPAAGSGHAGTSFFQNMQKLFIMKRKKVVGKLGAARFQKGFLDQVGGIHFPLGPPADLESGQERQVAAVTLQELSQGKAIAGAGLPQQVLGVGTVPGAHQHGPLISQSRKEGKWGRPNSDFFEQPEEMRTGGNYYRTAVAGPLTFDRQSVSQCHIPQQRPPDRDR